MCPGACCRRDQRANQCARESDRTLAVGLELGENQQAEEGGIRPLCVLPASGAGTSVFLCPSGLRAQNWDSLAPLAFPGPSSRRQAAGRGLLRLRRLPASPHGDVFSGTRPAGPVCQGGGGPCLTQPHSLAAWETQLSRCARVYQSAQRARLQVCHRVAEHVSDRESPLVSDCEGVSLFTLLCAQNSPAVRRAQERQAARWPPGSPAPWPPWPPASAGKSSLLLEGQAQLPSTGARGVRPQDLEAQWGPLQPLEKVAPKPFWS